MILMTIDEISHSERSEESHAVRNRWIGDLSLYSSGQNRVLHKVADESISVMG